MTAPRKAAQKAAGRTEPTGDVQPPQEAAPDAHSAPDTTPPHLTASISHTQVPRDPYPHPVTWPQGSREVLQDIFYAGRSADHAKARRDVESFNLLREPPEVQQYRAEVLAWFDRKGYPGNNT